MKFSWPFTLYLCAKNFFPGISSIIIHSCTANYRCSRRWKIGNIMFTFPQTHSGPQWSNQMKMSCSNPITLGYVGTWSFYTIYTVYTPTYLRVFHPFYNRSYLLGGISTTARLCYIVVNILLIFTYKFEQKFHFGQARAESHNKVCYR